MKLQHMNGKKGAHQLFLWNSRKSRIFFILYILPFHCGGTLPLVLGFNNPKYTKHVSIYHKWLMVKNKANAWRTSNNQSIQQTIRIDTSLYPFLSFTTISIIVVLLFVTFNNILVNNLQTNQSLQSIACFLQAKCFQHLSILPSTWSLNQLAP